MQQNDRTLKTYHRLYPSRQPCHGYGRRRADCRREGRHHGRPRDVPVAGRLLGGVWGLIGFWLMILGVYVGFSDTVFSNQDGFGVVYVRITGGGGG